MRDVASAVEGLLRSVTTLVRAATAAVGGAVGRAPPLRTGIPRLEHGAAMKAAWARLTPSQRKARAAAMRAGHAKAKRRSARKK